MNAGLRAVPPSPSSSSAGIVALLFSIAGCVVFPILAIVIGLGFHGSDAALSGIMVVLGIGAVVVIAATVLAIVALARGRGGKASAIVALVISVLSIPAGIFGGFAALLFLTGGGAHGRPFRSGGVARRTPLTSGSSWSEGGPNPVVRGLEPDVRAALADAWLADARLEHASIAAFGALALDLIALGAPPALVRLAHESALDEIAHARDTFALANAYASQPSTAAPFPQVRGPIGPESLSERLVRVAVETAVDGCVGEAAAAAVAREGAARAADPVVRTVLAKIAADEQRHADYALELLGWCLDVGDADLAAAVSAALEPMSASASSAPGLLDLGAHGRIDEEGWAAARLLARGHLVSWLAARRVRPMSVAC